MVTRYITFSEITGISVTRSGRVKVDSNITHFGFSVVHRPCRDNIVLKAILQMRKGDNYSLCSPNNLMNKRYCKIAQSVNCTSTHIFSVIFFVDYYKFDEH